MSTIYERILAGDLAGMYTEHHATGCWDWQHRTNAKGYGLVDIGTTTGRAHRLVYEALTGITVPTHLQVLHLCHRTSCVNPEHLSVGTDAANKAHARLRSIAA